MLCNRLCFVLVNLSSVLLLHCSLSFPHVCISTFICVLFFFLIGVYEVFTELREYLTIYRLDSVTFLGGCGGGSISYF